MQLRKALSGLPVLVGCAACVPDALQAPLSRTATASSSSLSTSVGERANYAAGDPAPFVVEVVSVGHANFGIFALKESSPDAEVARQFRQADGLLLDLRGTDCAARAAEAARVFTEYTGPIALLAPAGCVVPRAHVVEGSFDVAMGWLLAQTPKSRIERPSEYVIANESRDAEEKRLARLGLTSPENPVLPKPWATPLSRRSFVVPQGWLLRKAARVVYAPALLADLDALELVLPRAYGGYDSAREQGFDFARWFSEWRAQLKSAGAHWLPTASAFAPVDRLERFQLDNHTTIPLGVRFGAGSRTALLATPPGATCSALRTDKEHRLATGDPAQQPKRARRFDGEQISDAWYVTFPENRGAPRAIRCGDRWIDLTTPAAGPSPDRHPTLRHLTDDVAYLRLPTFHKANNEIIARERASWEKPSGNERGLVVDLRDNEGGDAAFFALEGWVAMDELKESAAFDRRLGASCLYPPLRWGYTSISSFGVQPPLTEGLRHAMQSGLDELFKPAEPQCPAAYRDERGLRHYRQGARAARPGRPRLLVLVNEHCGSDCEYMTGTLSKLPEAVVVGVNTFGLTGFIQPGYSALPNTRLPFRIALGSADVYGDHRSVDGYGLDVDIVLDGPAAWNESGLVRLLRAL